jgi:3-hydroxy-3-methylglutaryl CoA synthase
MDEMLQAERRLGADCCEAEDQSVLLEAFEAKSACQAAAVALRLAKGLGSEADMFQSYVLFTY